MTVRDNIPVGSIVKLKNGPDGVYTQACVGAEGMIREYKVEDGFEMAYIEWDKECWCYNGQSDGWTFANHFELKSLPQKIDKPKRKKLKVSDYISMAKEIPIDKDTLAFISELEKGFTYAAGSEGFIVMAVEHVRDPKHPERDHYVPQIFSNCKTTQARATLEILLANILAESHQDLMASYLERDD